METQLEGYDVDAVLAMGIRDLRNTIRSQKLHNKAGVSGTDLSKLNIEALRALAISGEAPTTEIETVEATATPEFIPGDDAAQALKLLEILKSLGVGSIDPQQIEAKIDAKLDQAIKEIEAKQPRQIEVVKPSGEAKVISRQHYKFELILKCIEQRCNVALVGPAGSGKSQLVRNVAESLELKFYPVSFNSMSSKADVLGFVDATGEYRESAVYRAFKHGGVLLADEFDACNAGIATILNAMMANRIATFAGGEVVEAHEDFIFVAAMNTFGTGADSQYVGRNRLDAATLDRFVFITFDYDQGLEAEIAGIAGYQSPRFDLDQGGAPTPDEWMSTVTQLRKRADEMRIKAIFSPRATIMGIKLAAAGVGRKHLVDMLISKGLTEVDKERLEIN